MILTVLSGDLGGITAGDVCGPVRRLLIGVAYPHEQRLVEVPANELERERQALGREAARQSDGRTTRHVERRGEARKLGEPPWRGIRS